MIRSGHRRTSLTMRSGNIDVRQPAEQSTPGTLPQWQLDDGSGSSGPIFGSYKQLDYEIAAQVESTIRNSEATSNCAKISAGDGDVDYLAASPIVSMDVTVITPKICRVETGTSRWHLLCEKVHDIFLTYSLKIKQDILIDLRPCPLASLSTSSPSIAFVFVQKLEFKGASEGVTKEQLIGRVNSRTEIRIGEMHCVDHLLRLVRAIHSSKNSATYCVIQSLSKPYTALRDLISLQCKRRKELGSELGTEKSVQGILLVGPSGCGKTFLVRELCTKHAVNLIEFDLKGELMSNVNPGSLIDYALASRKLNSLFHEAVESSLAYPTVLLLEHIHALNVGFKSLAPGATNTKSANNKQKVINHICKLLESSISNSTAVQVLTVIGTTDQVHQISPRLRMHGRFDNEVYVSLPNEKERQVILKSSTIGVAEFDQVDLPALSKRLPGFSGADIIKFIHVLRVKCFEQKSSSVCEEDIKFALTRVIPSVLVQQAPEQCSTDTGDFKRTSDLSLNQITGMDKVKLSLIKTIVWPLKHPDAFLTMGIPPPKGILLYGPPGCGKTSIVRAIANDHQTNFLSVSAAELFTSTVGDSEKIISELFHRGRLASPCILFIDELESVVGARSFSNSKGKSVNETILSMLLTEMDGIGSVSPVSSNRNESSFNNSLHGPRVVIVGATNRPDLIDSALLRPGRFDRIVPVPPPNEGERIALLKECCVLTPVNDDVDFDRLGRETERFSGADIVNLHREAGLLALAEDINCSIVSMKHYERARSESVPSLTKEHLKLFFEYSSRRQDS